jgi:mRNA interferase MazF
MKRGEIWWVDFEPARGSEIKKRRPAVILTDNGINRVRRTLVVVPLSSSPNPQPPLVISLRSAGKDSVAVCDQIRSVDKTRLSGKIGALPESEMRVLEKSMRAVLNL